MRNVIKSILIITAFALSPGCARSWQPVCRHEALYAAGTVAEERPVWVLIGPLYGTPHAVAVTAKERGASPTKPPAPLQTYPHAGETPCG